jgi:tetratricopeptide (TPR) repeat protein
MKIYASLVTVRVFVAHSVVALLMVQLGLLPSIWQYQREQAESEPMRLRSQELADLARFKVDPSFPANIIVTGVEKTVVEVVVDKFGDVVSARPLMGFSLFKSAGIEAAKQWKFSPYVIHGRQVSVVGVLTFETQGWLAKTPEEIAKLEADVAANPQSALRHYRLGMGYSTRIAHDVNYWDQRAVPEFRKCIELNAQFAPAYYELGRVLRSLGLYQEALRSFADTVKLDPDFTEAYYYLAGMYEQLNKVDEALTLWKRLIETNQDLDVLRISFMNLERIYRQLGRENEELAAMEKLIQIGVDFLTIYPGHPQSPHVYSYMAGEIYERLGRTDEAVNAYKRTIDIVRNLVPSDPNADEAAFAYLRLGELDERAGRQDQALDSYAHAIEMKPNLSSARLNMAVLLLKAGKRESAMKHYDYLKRSDPDKARKLGALLGLQ